MHIINRICAEFENSGIKYCHFKSNQHLDRSFEGKTDFDILVDCRKKTQADIILASLNCKRFENPVLNNYPGVNNWFAFDEGTGIVFHIHLHFQLVSGLAHVKEYALPMTDMVLNSAVMSPEYKIMISDPNAEMLLLLIRIVIKTGTLKRLLSLLGLFSLDSRLKAEFDYLLKRVDSAVVAEFAATVFSEKIADIIKVIIDKEKVEARSFRKLSACAHKELSVHKRIPGIQAHIAGLRARLYRLSIRIRKKLFGTKTISGKVTDSGGNIIAFIGIDGSGKSTLTKDILYWMAKSKIEARFYYMGTGKGARNIFARLNRLIRRTPLKRINLLRQIVKGMNVISTVKNNRKQIIEMHRFRTNGGFSITDRYPQLQEEGQNDGMKLQQHSGEHGNRIFAHYAGKERKYMQIVNKIQPDIVFRLRVSIDICGKRRPGSDLSKMRQKMESINRIEFPYSAIYEINAEQNYNKELLEVKRLIWDNIG